MNLEKIKRNTFVSCPFDLLKEKYIQRIVHEGINPEIGLNGGILDRFSMVDYLEVAALLREAGLSCTIHAPFTDLSLGALDPEIRQVTLKRLSASVDLAALFNAKALICHTGFDGRHYLGSEDEWAKNALNSLKSLLERVEKGTTPLVLENVYELDPRIHQGLFSQLGSKMLGFCLDLGHQKVFSATKLDGWLDALGERLVHLHLHDNNGKQDEHLAIGQGKLDFDALFHWLQKNQKRPLMTIEAHDEQAVIPSLMALLGLLKKYNMD